VQILYFAWVREGIGTSAEVVAPPAGIATVGALIGWLRDQSPRHAETLKDRKRLRVAVNQDFADDAAPVGPPDEVAIFPPVTGG